jgi:uncharacterized protein YndB with AHSA1/START domain
MSPAENTTLEITRYLDAPPERVFDAWLKREEWQAWIGPEGLNCDVPLLEPRIGGRYLITMRLPGGVEIPVGGVFKTIDAPNTLVFTWGRDGDPSRQSLITITLRASGSGTELSLRQEGLPDVTSRDSHTTGWNSTLNKLGYFLR